MLKCVCVSVSGRMKVQGRPVIVSCFGMKMSWVLKENVLKRFDVTKKVL